MSDFGAVPAGAIVVADWRGGLPKEANKQRPAIVVEAPLFAAGFPNVILVPLTDDPGLIIPGLTVAISPTAENGCTKPSWAISYNVTATSKARLRRTPSRITAEQLADIRRQVAVAVGAVEP
jgi:mRNA-degrading endonuclease toxin of MazEF toxin-antitoxin module